MANRETRRRCKKEGHRPKTGSKPEEGWFCAECGEPVTKEGKARG